MGPLYTNAGGFLLSHFKQARDSGSTLQVPPTLIQNIISLFYPYCPGENRVLSFICKCSFKLLDYVTSPHFIYLFVMFIADLWRVVLRSRFQKSHSDLRCGQHHSGESAFSSTVSLVPGKHLTILIPVSSPLNYDRTFNILYKWLLRDSESSVCRCVFSLVGTYIKFYFLYYNRMFL